MQETKCKRRPVPRRCRSSTLGYEVAHAGFNQWNGVAIASRVGLDDVAGRLRRACRRGAQARGRPPRGGPRARRDLRRRAGVEPVRAQRPHARTTRTTSTSWTGWPRCAIRPQAGCATTRRADRPGRRLEHRADRRRRLGHRRVRRARTHVSAPERAAFHAIVDAGFTDVVRACTPGPGSTRTGTTRSCGSRRSRACGSTSSSARRRWPAGDRRADRPRRAQGQGASDHAPVLVDVPVQLSCVPPLYSALQLSPSLVTWQAFV